MLMVTITLRCPFCESDKLTKYGRAPNGKQRYKCQACGRQHRENPAPQGYLPERREEILRAYDERSSLRGLSRTFGVSRNAVTSWIKKSRSGTTPGDDPGSSSTNG